MTFFIVFLQGLEKGYDYKKVLKAFKKGAQSLPHCSLPVCCNAGASILHASGAANMRFVARGCCCLLRVGGCKLSWPVHVARLVIPAE